MIELLKFICLFFGLMLTVSNLGQAIYEKGIGRNNIIWWALFTAGFIWLQWIK